MDAYLFVYYENYKGGINNLQIAKIVTHEQYGNYIKVFSSTVDKAEKYAKSWAKKNNIFLKK
jgi:phosphatidylserine decarboxylase